MTNRVTSAKAATIDRTATLGLVGLLSAILMLALGCSASFGADLRMTVERPHFTCEGRVRHFSDVAYHPGQADAAPLPCCDGQIGCAQFLSTNTIVRATHEWHG